MSFGHDDAYYELDEAVQKLISALKKEILSSQAQAVLKEVDDVATELRKAVEDMP